MATDNRDLRDPIALGEQLLHPGLKSSVQRQNGREEVTLSEVYEHMVSENVFAEIPNYSPTASTLDETVALYRKQMTERAAQGDAYARRVCLDKDWAYDRSREGEDEESVRARDERLCFERGPHNPHMWTRLTGGRVELYACPGVVSP